jgi:CRP/FNR family transcriptional regulator, cyclic AMP receptor protein
VGATLGAVSATPAGPLDASGGGSLSIFDQEFRARLEELGTARRFERGEIVFHAGDVSQTVHLIRRGVGRIVRWTADGNEVVLEEKRAGQLIGEFSALDALPRSASVVAVGRLDTVEVSGPTFVKLLDEHPRAAMPLLREMARLLRNAGETRVVLRSGDVASRVAARLGELATDDTAGPPIRIACRHEDLASWVSVNRETVTRALGRLRDEGLIRTGRGYVEVVDPVGLARRAMQ